MFVIKTIGAKSDSCKIKAQENQESIQISRISLRYKNCQKIQRIADYIVVKSREDVGAKNKFKIPKGKLYSVLKQECVKDGTEILASVGKGCIMLGKSVANAHKGFSVADKY